MDKPKHEFVDYQVALSAVPLDDQLLFGLVVVFNELSDADAFFACVLSYFETPAGQDKSLRINLDSQQRTIQIQIISLSGTLDLQIYECPEEIFVELPNTLHRHPYYFIMGAYRDGDSFALADVQSHHLYLSHLVFDGVRMIGNRDGFWPSFNPLLSDH